MKQFYCNKHVLITGGSGFIGSHLVEKLVELGAQVAVIDNLSTGFLHNIAAVTEKITFLEESITDFQVCLNATKQKDIIFHLAAQTSVPESVQKPNECFTTNVRGTFNLLEAARINNVQRFAFSSSAAVYGAQKEECSENMTCKPTSPYGTSKRIGELLCQEYAHNYGLQTICLRYFNVFGTRQNPHGTYSSAVAKFTDRIKNNKQITLFGDGQQTRDFISVHNVVKANLLCGMQKKMHGQPINIATGKSISLLELIKKIKKEFPNYSKTIKHKPERKGDIKHSRANTSLLEKIYNQQIKENYL